jgi:hypothetical protein
LSSTTSVRSTSTRTTTSSRSTSSSSWTTEAGATTTRSAQFIPAQYTVVIAIHHLEVGFLKFSQRNNVIPVDIHFIEALGGALCHHFTHPGTAFVDLARIAIVISLITLLSWLSAASATAWNWGWPGIQKFVNCQYAILVGIDLTQHIAPIALLKFHEADYAISVCIQGLQAIWAATIIIGGQ